MLVSEEVKVARLKNFVIQRISSILQLEGLDISLKSIMDRLKLEYMQVKQLCKFKLDVLNDQRKLSVGSDRILQNDLIVAFKDMCALSGKGFYVSAF